MLKSVAALLLLLAVAGCSSSSDSSESTVYGTWLYTNGDAGQGLTIRKDNTYTFDVLRIVSATSFDAYAEMGNVVVTSSSFSFAPLQWSCSGPNPSSSATYSLSGDTLDVAFSGGVVAYQRDTASGSNVAITYGCFATDGTFTPHPLGNGT